jgi:hypothetical protein
MTPKDILIKKPTNNKGINHFARVHVNTSENTKDLVIKSNKVVANDCRSLAKKLRELASSSRIFVYIPEDMDLTALGFLGYHQPQFCISFETVGLRINH